VRSDFEKKWKQPVLMVVACFVKTACNTRTPSATFRK
jgi:hypothetical protein